MRVVRPIAPPGLNLEMPKDMTPELFMKQIGGDCEEIHDKFETMEEIFNEDSWDLKQREIPVQQRKYIMRKLQILNFAQVVASNFGLGS